MKIGFVTADWSDVEDPATGLPTLGGSGWMRCGIPAAELKKHGHETVVVELISVSSDGIWLHDWYGETHNDCDVIVFQRWMNKEGPRVMEQAKAAGQVVVNDVDDWYWGLDQRNLAYRFCDPKVNPESNRDHYWKTCLASDLITVSTPFLAAKMDSMPNVALVRNALDLDRWDYNPRETNEPVFGWTGSVKHRSGDLETMIGILGPFLKQHNLKFRHVGHWGIGPTAGDIAGVPSELQLTSPIASILDYPALFSGIDIGIVPLNKIPFNEGKSCLKGMEYAAAGIPFVAERTPEYKWLQEEHGIGLTASKPREWLKQMERLLDPNFRLAEATKNRSNLRHLGIGACWSNWIDAYASVLS